MPKHDRPQTEVKHPPEYEKDLNPDHMAGQNIGHESADVSSDYVIISKPSRGGRGQGGEPRNTLSISRRPNAGIGTRSRF